MTKTQQKLRSALDSQAFALAKANRTTIKDYKTALQKTTESLFPGKHWYDITSCDISAKLVETRNITETIDCIVEGLKEDVVIEMLKENDAITFTIPPEAMNDPSSVDFKAIMAKQRADHEARKAKEAEQKKREELRAKYADLLSKVTEAEDKHEVLFDALVPGSGACDTVAGELIRAITKIMYRDYNDGDLFYEGYGIETAGNAASYLSDHGFEDDIIHIAEMGLEDDAYTKALEKLDAKIIQSIIDNPELLETPLDYDMYEADSDWLKDYQPRYEYSYGVSEKIGAYLDAGLINSWDCVQVVEEWLHDSAFEGAEVSRPWGHSDKEYNIENLTKDGLEQCQNWERWNMWEDYENDLYEQYGDPTEEDEEYDESVKRPIKESTWAENTVSFTQIAQNKLNTIRDAGLWDDMEEELENNPKTSNIICGVFTDMYRTAKPEYSSYSADQIKAAKKEMFRIINDFYKKALSANTEPLTEDEEYDESVKRPVKESTWAEREMSFTRVTLNKLEKIHSAGLWNEFEDAVDNNSTTCNIITGVFTDMYRTAKPEYSSYSEEDIKLARKELFRIINTYYKKALAANTESVKRPIKESTWAEREIPFTNITQDKLEKIRDTGLWDDMEDEIDNNPKTSNIISGIFTDIYHTAKPEYSDYSDEQIKVARKEMFRIINDFYKKALAASTEPLTEDSEDFNPIAWKKEIPKWSLSDVNFVQKLLGPSAIAEISENYLEIKAATNDYIQSGIVNVSDKFIEEFTAYVEKTYPNWTIRHNNTASIYWLTNKR